MVRQLGPAREVADSYVASVDDREIRARSSESVGPDGVADSADAASRTGSGEIRITSVEILDGSGAPTPVLVTGQACTFRMHYLARRELKELAFVLGFIHESKANVTSPNSARTGSISTGPGTGYIDFSVDELLVQAGSYRVATTVVEHGHIHDHASEELILRVRGRPDDESGLMRMPGRWSAPVMTGR
jgi:ABC-2 type transport system ATP-binding protein/lipopolysaccharide transport system ATP-binding protein